jgi:predicted nucleic acid-binding protein
VCYADSSALAKLLVAEPESEALVAHLGDASVVSSELSETELRRVALRAGGERAIPLAERLLAKVTTIPLTVAILREAGVLPPCELRSLDAIHLATALSLDEVVIEFACYDARLAKAAGDRGLAVVAPS